MTKRDGDLLSLYIPVSYWLRTRLPQTGQKWQYLLIVLMPQVVWLVAILDDIPPDDISQLMKTFIVSFIGMIAVYEIGYVDNDYRAQRRERAAGLSVRKTDSSPLTGRDWVVTIGVRFLVVGGVIAALALNSVETKLYTGWLMLLLATFLLHNMVLGRVRIVTFFVLYFIRMQLPVVVTASSAIVDAQPEAYLAWELFCLIYSIFFSLSYGIRKTFICAGSWLSSMGGVEMPILAIGMIGVGAGGFFSVLPFDWAEIVGDHLGVLGGLMLLYLCGWGFGRFIVEMYRGLRCARYELTHAHTNFSHDAAIEKEHYRQWLAVDPRRRVYLTDHVEDFSGKRYEELKQKYQDLWPRVVPGLEYSLVRQHILVHGLRHYVDIDGMPTHKALSRLKEHGQRLIWAHPRISIRKLVRWSYWKEILTLMGGVDGLEFHNRKNANRLRFVLMMLIVSWVACTLYGRRMLFVGHDAHAPEELPGRAA